MNNTCRNALKLFRILNILFLEECGVSSYKIVECMEKERQTLDNRRRKYRSLATLLALVLLFILFEKSGLGEQIRVERLRELGQNPLTPLLIISAMTAAWTFALPGSLFFFVTPLLFAPLEATAIICVGSAAGTAAGYSAARYVGGPWVERFREHRVTKFLERHSTFASLFAIRIVPSSQHGLINYGAGLLKIPIGKFMAATLCAIAIKAFLYAKAIEGSVGASSIGEALNWQTLSALSALGLIALVGHMLQRRSTNGRSADRERNGREG
jgi:uncharacterized membrane protein YdjX (TVP38/TMEM64 family)